MSPGQNGELFEEKNRITSSTKGFRCGNANVSSSYDDLGFFEKTDKCCRDHDYCAVYINSQEYNYGLFNNGKFAKSHCDCDKQLYDCLKNTKSAISDLFGNIYFNFVEGKCFKEEYPSVCVNLSDDRCTEFIVDETKPKVYQWFDNERY